MKKAIYLFFGVILAITLILFLAINPVIYDYYFIYFMLEESGGYKSCLTFALLIADIFLLIAAIVLIGSAMETKK
jgi:hypothetical protein